MSPQAAGRLDGGISMMGTMGEAAAVRAGQVAGDFLVKILILSHSVMEKHLLPLHPKTSLETKRM